MENIIIKNANGDTITYDVLFTFDMGEKSYVIYTEQNQDESTQINLYYASYKQDGEKITLEPVEDEEEIKIIEDIISDFEKTIRDEE